MTDPYADAAPTASPEAPPEQETQAPAQEQEGEDAQTAEIPKAALGSAELKPGARVEMEVVQVNEDSVLVKVAEKEQPQESAEAPAQSPPPQGGPMSAMLG